MPDGLEPARITLHAWNPQLEMMVRRNASGESILDAVLNKTGEFIPSGLTVLVGRTFRPAKKDSYGFDDWKSVIRHHLYLYEEGRRRANR